MKKTFDLTSKKDSDTVRDRYINVLAPGLVVGNWQTHEEAIIYREHAAGKGWAAIAKLLKGRSAKSIKNR